MNKSTVLQKVTVAPAIAGVLGREIWMDVNITGPEAETIRAAIQELRVASDLVQRAMATANGVVSAPGGQYVSVAKAKADFRESVAALSMFFANQWATGYEGEAWTAGDITGLFSQFGEAAALALMGEALTLAEKFIAFQNMTI